ncbi:MAG: DUF2911 domain-containing protein [Chitinophagaceae bacterium]
MKLIWLCCFYTLLALTSAAQLKPTEVDRSPLDVSYWPANYPFLKMSGKTKDLPIARVIYSRPQKNNRTIFGGIIKYREMWRLGANEATEVEFFSNVLINGKSLKKGRYSLFCIPDETKWTLIFNSDNYSWGNFSYDSKKDVLRTDITVQKNTDSVEYFTMYFDEYRKGGAYLTVLWDDVIANIPIIIGNEVTATPKKK